MLDVINPGDIIVYSILMDQPITVRVIALSKDGGWAYCKTRPYDHPGNQTFLDVRTETLKANGVLQNGHS